MAQGQTANLPTPTGTKALAGLKGKQKRFITILQDDFNFDIVKEIVDHYQLIKRAKKIKPLEKARLMQHYLLTLLTFCVPKMKVTEEQKGSGKPVQFSINIGGTPTQPDPTSPNQVNGGVNITIPTTQQPDGSYAVDKILP